MTTPRIDQARQLVADVRAALDAAGLEKATATLDAALVPSGARYGVVVVAAPKLDFSASWSDVAAVFELHVIAGPADDYLAAWAVIDAIIQALAEAGVNLRTGEPGAYQTLTGGTLPAYTLTTNDPE